MYTYGVIVDERTDHKIRYLYFFYSLHQKVTYQIPNHTLYQILGLYRRQPEVPSAEVIPTLHNCFWILTIRTQEKNVIDTILSHETSNVNVFFMVYIVNIQWIHSFTMYQNCFITAIEVT